MAQPTHILIIEDDPAIAEGLRAGLEREGYSVAWKDRGDTGLRYAEERQPQLVILDLRLPDGSGLDICRAMRQRGLRQPILILTVQTDEIDTVLGLELGADDYLAKPYRLSELRARVRALLRRAYGDLASAEADMLYVGDLLIDRGRAQVSRNGQSIALSPTEFRLLVHLARHQNQALSRAQLLDAVWGYDTAEADENAVTVAIRRLRERVERDPSRPALILTVPGIGYRLVG